MSRKATLPVQVVVLAKRPRPGRVKTRLTPPYTPAQAASLAAAALHDTMRAVASTPCADRVLVFDGPAGRWAYPGFTVVPQRGGGLAERLGSAFADAHARAGLPILLVGMDTPQLDVGTLVHAAHLLISPAHDAVLGPATDGGYWTVGLRHPNPDAFTDVPMSTAQTYRHQRARLAALGLRIGTLRALTDVDDAATADSVADCSPGTRFARRLAALRGARPHRCNLPRLARAPSITGEG